MRRRKLQLGAFSFLLLLLSVPTVTSRVATWHFEDVAEIRAYRINWEEWTPDQTILDEDWSLNESRLPAEGVVLNDRQKAKLKRAVYGIRFPRMDKALCFYPHHAFVIHNSSGEICGAIDVCFQCNRVRSEPVGITQSFDLASLRQLFGELGMPIENKNWAEQGEDPNRVAE